MEENEERYKAFINDFKTTMCNLTDNHNFSNIVFLCIGTDNLIGDSFGPLVGDRLKVLFRDSSRLNVIGTLDNNVSLENIREVLENISSKYSNPFIISIDAALSNTNSVGDIVVTEGGISIGSCLSSQAVNNVGDMSIRGVVGRNLSTSNQNFNILQNAHLYDISNLAKIVSAGIFNSINYEENA